MPEIELTPLEKDVLDLKEIVRLTDIFFSVSSGKNTKTIYRTLADINSLQNRIVKAINDYKDSRKIQ